MDHWPQQFDAYPHWLVIASLVATALVVLWVFGKVFKWVLKFTLLLAALVVVCGIIFWAFL